MQSRHLQQIALSLAVTACLGGVALAQPARAARKFQIVEATIADIHQAIRSKQITATQLVNMYLARIKAYNGTCVNEPQGILGPVTPIPHAGAQRADDAEPPACGAPEVGLRRAQSAQHDRLGRQRPDMPDALGDSGGARPAISQHRAAGRARCTASCSASRTCTGHVRHAHDQRRDADFANDRPPDRRDPCEAPAGMPARSSSRRRIWGICLGSRSAFGGTMCNPYDTTRDVGGSSGGSASSVAANLVTCAISEEGGPSIRMPSRLNNGVGLSPSQGLVSRDGMIGGGGLNDRVGPACRTVEDAARVLDVIAGYDPADELDGL